MLEHLSVGAQVKIAGRRAKEARNLTGSFKFCLRRRRSDVLDQVAVLPSIQSIQPCCSGLFLEVDTGDFFSLCGGPLRHKIGCTFSLWALGFGLLLQVVGSSLCTSGNMYILGEDAVLLMIVK
jgi:hypothetical protein